MNEPRVSVIIAAYNAKDFIARAIDSALQQSLQPFEIIVVDDCSTDGTADFLRDYAANNPVLKILPLSRNGGPSAARNAGISIAQGDWLAILDADDAFYQDRLEKLTSFAVQTEADIVADDLAYYDAAAKMVVGHGLDGTQSGQVSLHDFLAHNRADGSGLDWGLLKPLFKREMLLRHNILYNDGLKHGEDFQIIVDLLLAGARFSLLPEPLYLYTQRHGSHSQRPSGLSRTIVAYGKLRDSALALAQDPRISADPQAVHLLELRAKGLGRQEDAQYISQALRHGAYLGLARKIFHDTSFFPFMCAQICRALRRRLHVAS